MSPENFAALQLCFDAHAWKTLNYHIVLLSKRCCQLKQARGKEAMVAGFYHEVYEEPLLMLMKRRGVHSGLVVKGEEGALSMTTKAWSANASKGLPVNYCAGFRLLDMPMPYEVDGVSLKNINFVVNAEEYGLEPTDTPRTDKLRRCVFVGNISYDATEEQLIHICEEVGPVVLFRLVTDRETGKPKGYGFCEYKDEETALSARRNLQGCEINGRQLRVDFAENDKNAEKSREQGHGGPGMTANIGDAQKQVGGQAVRPGSSLHQPVGLPVAVAAANVMAGALGGGQIAVKSTQIGLETQTGIGTDPLTMHLSKMSRNQLIDILSELKVLATENKEQARQLLLAVPLLPKAIFQAQVMLGVVTPQMLQMPNIRQAFFPSGQGQQSVNQSLSSLPPLAQNKMHFESTLKSQEGEVPAGQPNLLVQKSYTLPSQPRVQLPILSQNQYQQVPTPVLPGVSTVLPTHSQNIANMSIRPQTQATTSPYVKQQVQPSFQNRGQAAPANLGNNSQLLLPHGNIEPSVLSSSLNMVIGPKYANTAYDRPQLVNNSDRDTYKLLPQGLSEKVTMTHDNQNTVNHPNKLIKLNDGRSSSSSVDVNVSNSVSGSFQVPGMYMNHPKAEETSTSAKQTSQLAPEMESALLQQVLSLTPEQLSSLPPDQQQQVIELQQMLRLS